jgi:hypothetical protein
MPKKKKSQSSRSKSNRKNKVKGRKHERSTARQKSQDSISSYETWLSVQVKDRIKHPSSGAKPQRSVNPENTFDTWLKKQRAVEKQEPVLSKPVADTYDEWIRKQVAGRQSRADENKEAQPMGEAVPQ